MAASAAPAAADTITTVAGNGSVGFSGDGGPATAAGIVGPVGVAPRPDGGFLLTHDLNTVRKVSGSGIITTVAGGTYFYCTTTCGPFPPAGDGGPATAASLKHPSDVVSTPDGGFLIADWTNGLVRKVDSAGIIHTVAGGGNVTGDGGPATSASLGGPHGVALTADGGFLIADSLFCDVRKVDSAGIIHTVAGTPRTCGYSGDRGPATSATLNVPYRVAATADNGFLIADKNNNVVRKVDATGRIQTVAGNGTAGYSGDGGPAGSAALRQPWGVAATADNGFLIADHDNNVVRKVDAAGTIRTVAGTGRGGFSGDGGPPTAAQLFNPAAVAATADGGFLIADTLNARVRKVTPGKGSGSTPVLSSLRGSPRKQSIVGRKVNGKCVMASKRNNNRPRCTRRATLTIGYTINTAGNVKFTLRRQITGRKVNGKCVRLTNKNKNRRKCALLVGAGQFIRIVKTGTSSFVVTGKFGSKKLIPGSYVLTATPAGGTSRTARFAITG